MIKYCGRCEYAFISDSGFIVGCDCKQQICPWEWDDEMKLALDKPKEQNNVICYRS